MIKEGQDSRYKALKRTAYLPVSLPPVLPVRDRGSWHMLTGRLQAPFS